MSGINHRVCTAQLADNLSACHFIGWQIRQAERTVLEELDGLAVICGPCASRRSGNMFGAAACHHRRDQADNQEEHAIVRFHIEFDR